MLEHIDPQLLSRLDALCQKLGIAANYLWPHFMRAALVSGLTSVIWFALLISVAAWFFRMSHAMFTASSCSEDTFFASCTALVCFACACFATYNLCTALEIFANPQITALHMIFETVGH